MKARFLPLLLAALLLCCSGCGGAQRFQYTYADVFDTVTTITVCARDQSAADALASLLHSSLLEDHRRFDIYQEYAGMQNLCTVNRLAGVAPVKLDAETLALLSFALELGEASDWKLNVCMGSLLSLWHGWRSSGREPNAAAIQAAMAHVNGAALVLDQKAGTAFLTDQAAQLDVGAVAKGWAVQRACEAAKAQGYTDFLVSAGGNVCAVGQRSAGTNWRIGLEDPAGSGEAWALLSLCDQSAVSSGSYQRRYTVNGQTYHHIIDPETGYPGQNCTMVTVICQDSAVADALSTSLFLLPRDQGAALAARYGAEAIWLLPDGTIDTTAGFSAYLEGGSGAF